ncbi:hypothetical protein EVJ32_09730 [Exiguobacterium sp. SH5S4]|uniref:hypothetical protein n=1 Tax=Exiguobacterium sp. SH5S4 TaxID=2510961 RepID=UPI00103B916A|nr:hypothetical protein [Exiguobacterium sp. SH5S4]TCI25591.1 hypothetical protein EVJ32_09730 [Exiguobacterium sp. SH5S4]
MQLAIIGTKEEISEVLKFVEKMHVITKNERVVRAEFSSRIDERIQLQFDDMHHAVEKAGSL